MRRSFGSALLVVVIAALGAAGCEDDTPPTTIRPDPELVTETFTGSISQNGAATHPFLATQAGAVRATLTTIEPDATIAVGLTLGTWNGAVCQAVLSNDNALQGAVINGTASVSTTLCVRIQDVGRLVGAINYTITVLHP
jgi:hypothetical protein